MLRPNWRLQTGAGSAEVYRIEVFDETLRTVDEFTIAGHSFVSPVRRDCIDSPNDDGHDQPPSARHQSWSWNPLRDLNNW